MAIPKLSPSKKAEGIKTIEAAKTQYHGRCQTLWNAPDVLSAHVAIVNEQLDVVEGYKEYIHHEPSAERTLSITIGRTTMNDEKKYGGLSEEE